MWLKKHNDFEKFEKIKNKKKWFGFIACFYIRKSGEFVAYTQGKNYNLSNFTFGNINDYSDKEIYDLILKLYQDKLDGKCVEVDGSNGIVDPIYEWEKEDYKLDKCSSVKYISIGITNVWPNCVVVIDRVCTGKHCWGGGRYTHIVEMKNVEQELISKIKDIITYKDGHLPGISDDEKKKYRASVTCCKDGTIVCKKK